MLKHMAMANTHINTPTHEKIQDFIGCDVDEVESALKTPPALHTVPWLK